MRRLVLILLAVIVLAVAVVAGVYALKKTRMEEQTLAIVGEHEKLTPSEFLSLTEKEKFQYRDIEILIPELFGYVFSPPDRGMYESAIDRLVHTSQNRALRSQLSRAMFELEHPRVKVTYLPYDMWSRNQLAMLAVSMAQNRAPAIYVVWPYSTMMEEGTVADITDLVETWPEARDHPATKALGTFDKRIYFLPDRRLQSNAIYYRKDMFREAGIFNEDGEPGPPRSWTWEDFRRYAKMLTKDKDGDGKIDQWGFSMMFSNLNYAGLNGSMNIPYFIPDKSGKNTWRFNDGPEILEAMRRTRSMYREDKSVIGDTTTDFRLGWDNFKSGKAAMIIFPSTTAPGMMLYRPHLFRADMETKDVVGVTFIPGGDHGLKNIVANQGMFGFNPKMSKEQLAAALEWYRSWSVGTVYRTEQWLESKIQKIVEQPDYTISTLFMHSYKSGYQTREVDFTKFFPRDVIYLYEKMRTVEYPPTLSEYGLIEPKGIYQVIGKMNSELLYSAKVNIEELLVKTADIANTNYLNYKQEGDVERFKAYYEDRLDFFKRKFPDYYPYYREFVMKNCKVW